MQTLCQKMVYGREIFSIPGQFELPGGLDTSPRAAFLPSNVMSPDDMLLNKAPFPISGRAAIPTLRFEILTLNRFGVSLIVNVQCRISMQLRNIFQSSVLPPDHSVHVSTASVWAALLTEQNRTAIFEDHTVNDEL